MRSDLNKLGQEPWGITLHTKILHDENALHEEHHNN